MSVPTGCFSIGYMGYDQPEAWYFSMPSNLRKFARCTLLSSSRSPSAGGAVGFVAAWRLAFALALVLATRAAGSAGASAATTAT
eukprot:5621417-Amphidinium_carterae.1